MKKMHWITWEDHRRSRELAKVLGAEYVVFTNSGNRFIRYPILTFKTIKFLIRNKNSLFFCQNPSIVLCTIVCALKYFFKYRVVVDRHSNFKFHTIKSINPKWIMFHLLSGFTIKSADITIVTNEYLREYIDNKGGCGFVLQDKLPSLDSSKKQVDLNGVINFVFISTFSDDEPIFEIVEAARMVGPKFHVYITGSYKKFKEIDSLISCLPGNVTLTGFISEEDYQSLLSSAEIIIVITEQEYTLTCGAYEAVALGKPMILGNTRTIKEYFHKGAVYTDPKASEITDSMFFSVEHIQKNREQVEDLKNILRKDWEARFKNLLQEVNLFLEGQT